VDPQIVNLYWPILIIAAGIFILGKTFIVSKKKSFHMFDSGYNGSELRNGVIEENNIFSGSKRKFQDIVFRGGKRINKKRSGLFLMIDRSILYLYVLEYLIIQTIQ
jgi:hypothetical protein